jgi:hypothetical protein
MAQDPDAESAAEAPIIEVEPQADGPEPPVMLTDAMCGLACQIRPETPLA